MRKPLKPFSAVDEYKSPIAHAVLTPLRKQLGGMMEVVKMSAHSVTLQARAPFTLGLMIGSVMNRFVRDGVSYDELTVNTKELTMKVKIAENSSHNRLRTTFV